MFLALMFYHFALFISTRNIDYLYYALYIMLITIIPPTASKLAMQKVVTVIADKATTLITSQELNAIGGVSGAVEGVDYSKAFANGTYQDPADPTASEIQAIINALNTQNDQAMNKCKNRACHWWVLPSLRNWIVSCLAMTVFVRYEAISKSSP